MIPASVIPHLPRLTIEEENALALDKDNQKSIDKLAMHHARVVTKVARQYLSSGIPFDELVSVGFVGLMRAVRGYNPDKSRFYTYAILWIKAELNLYIQKNHCMYTAITKSEHRSMFFNLAKVMRKLGINHVNDETAIILAEHFGTTPKEVLDFVIRIKKSVSLNAMVGDSDNLELIDTIVGSSDSNPEMEVAHAEEMKMYNGWLVEAMEKLNPRELEVFKKRKLVDEDDIMTLEEIGQQWGVSRERVRQVEANAMKKIKDHLL